MFVGETAGIKRADPKSLGIVADYSIADVANADILLVPGGRGEAQVREKPHVTSGCGNRRDYSVDHVGLHGIIGARRGWVAEGTAGDDASGATREVARVRRRAAISTHR